MTTLDDPRVKVVLDKLHGAAAKDWQVIARGLPSLAWGLVHGRGLEETMAPRLKHAYIPVDPESGRILCQTARAIGARTIVEFGTSFGISAVYLAAAVPDNGGGCLVGTEMEPNKIEAARRNLEAAGLADVAEIRAGDARETLANFDRTIDLLFLDGWKPLCLPILQLLRPKLRPGAVVFCDDVTKFRKTLASYVDYVRAKENGLISALLPGGDGMEYSLVVA